MRSGFLTRELPGRADGWFRRRSPAGAGRPPRRPGSRNLPRHDAGAGGQAAVTWHDAALMTGTERQANRVVGTVEPLAQQQIVDPCHPQAVTPRSRLVLHQQRIQPLLEWADPGKRLHRPLVCEARLGRADRLPHHLARQSKVTRDRLDRLAVGVLTPDPYNRLHYQHPDPARLVTAKRTRLNHRDAGSFFDADHPATGVLLHAGPQPQVREAARVRFAVAWSEVARHQELQRRWPERSMVMARVAWPISLGTATGSWHLRRIPANVTDRR